MSVDVSGGALRFGASIDMGTFEADLARLQRGMDKFNDSQRKQSEGIEAFAKKAAKAAAGFLSLQAAEGFISKMVQVRGEFQQIEIAFTTMLKSKDKADKLMAEAVRLAAITPFTLKEVASGAKQLLAYGVEASAVTRNLEMLGNVAAGVGSQLNEVVYLYGTLKSSGRVTQMDINQFAGRGIPIYEELVNVLNQTGKGAKKTTEDIRGMVTAGQIGFPQIEKAFQNMTGPAGKFFNLMQEQSKSLTGQLSNLEDAIDRAFNDLGKNNQGLLSGAIEAAIDLVDNYQKIIDIIQILIITYGAYRAALIITSLTTTGATLAETLHYGALVAKDAILKLVTASTATAAATTALYTAVIGALAAVIYALVQQQSEEEIVQNAVNQARKDGAKSAEIEQEKINALISTMKSSISTKQDQINAYNELKAATNGAIDNFSLEEVASGKADDALGKYVGTIRNATIAESEYAAYKGLEQKLDDLAKKGIDAISMWDKLAQSIKNTFGFGELSGKEWWEGLFDSDKAESTITKQIEKTYKNAQNQIVKQNSAVAKKVADAARERNRLDTEKRKEKSFNDLLGEGNVIGNFDKLLKMAPNKPSLDKLKETVNGLMDALSPGDKAISDYQKKIARVDKVLEQYSGTKTTKAATKATNDRIRFLDDLSKVEAAAIAAALNQNEEAVKQIEAKYTDLRNKANKLKLGANVLSKIDSIETKEKGTTKYKQETTALQTELEKQKQLYADFETVKNELGLDTAKSRYEKLINLDKTYVKVLQDEQQKLASLPVDSLTGAQQERLLLLNKFLLEEKRLVQQTEDSKLSDALKASDTLKTKRIKILDDYLKQKSIIEKDDTIKEKDERLKQLKEATDMQLDALTDEGNARTDLFKRLSRETLLLTRQQIVEQVAQLNKLLSDIKLPPEVKKGIEDQLKVLSDRLNIGADQSNLDALNSRRTDVIAAIALEMKKAKPEVEALNNELRQLNGEIAKLDSNGDGATNFADKLAAKFEYLSGSTEQFAAGLSGDLGQVAGVFSDLSAAVGGVDTETGYLLDTIGSLVGVASDAAGAVASFASGDIIGGIAKTVKALAGLLSIGKKVKEMNAAARKVIQDYYDAAIEGERVYQEKLKERELQNIRNNKTAIQGIKDEIALRKKQTEDYGKEMSDIMAKLQKEQYVADYKYTHGTWFRKAKTDRVMGDLSGKSFDEISKLFYQGKFDDEKSKGVKDLVARLIELEQKGYDASAALAELAKQTAAIFTGTNVDNLTDSLTNLFKEGKTSVKDFTEFFEQTMEDAALSIFKNRILADLMTKFYDDFASKAQSGEQLTQSEIEALRVEFFNMTEEAKKKFEELKAITGVDFTVKVDANTQALNDKISELFRTGINDAKKFGDAFQEILTDSVFNSFKAEVFEEGLKGFYQKLTEFQKSDGVLTKEEISQLQVEYNAFIEDAKSKFKILEEASGLNFSFDGAKIDDNFTALQDKIKTLFDNGTVDAKDFGNTFTEIINEAVLNGFKSTVFADGLKDFYKKLTDAQQKGILDKTTISELKTEYEKFVEEAKIKLKELEEATGLTLSGSITEIDSSLTSLEDSLVAIFQSGNYAAEDFTENFSNLMKKSIMETFKATALRDQLTNFYNQFKELSTSGGSLTKNEIETLKLQYDQIIRDSQQKFEDLQKVTGVSFDAPQNQSALANGISRSITEETGSELAGLWRGMYDEYKKQGVSAKRMLDIAFEQIELIRKIEQNTRATAENTNGVIALLTNISNNTRTGSARTNRDLGITPIQ